MNINIEPHPLRQIPDFSKGKILVVGDVMLDSYWHGITNRISPEAPVPVVRIDQEEVRVGGAGNVALNVAALGSSVALIGLVGDDSAAIEIKKLLLDGNVTPIMHVVAGSKTIKKLRIVSKNQQLIRADFEDNFPNSNLDLLLEDFKEKISEVDVILLSDYKKGALRNCNLLIQAARSLGKAVIVDPKGSDFELYRGATLITPNMSEFEAIVGACETEDEIVQRGTALREQLELDAILITRSEKGMLLLARGHEAYHLPTRAQEVFDVTGAGDTVVATLGASLAAGIQIHDAVMLSNIAAGIVVAKLGTATVSADELQNVLHALPKDERFHGLVSEDRLLDEIQISRALGERIVMTNGCFDILHPGHLDFLENARLLGDRLIVALNDDESVQEIKGSSRPINHLASRVRMLTALTQIDWVVTFSEATPTRLISKLLPDILVKGGDYEVEEIAGSEAVIDAGGIVQILGFTNGYSTTKVIEKIRRIER